MWTDEDDKRAADNCADYSKWQPGASGYPGDQQKDLANPYWAEIGTETQDRWSWSIIMSDDSTVVADGIVPSEEEAKAAVDNWEKENLREEQS